MPICACSIRFHQAVDTYSPCAVLFLFSCFEVFSVHCCGYRSESVSFGERVNAFVSSVCFFFGGDFCVSAPLSYKPWFLSGVAWTSGVPGFLWRRALVTLLGMRFVCGCHVRFMSWILVAFWLSCFLRLKWVCEPECLRRDPSGLQWDSGMTIIHSKVASSSFHWLTSNKQYTRFVKFNNRVSCFSDGCNRRALSLLMWVRITAISVRGDRLEHLAASDGAAL